MNVLHDVPIFKTMFFSAGADRSIRHRPGKTAAPSNPIGMTGRNLVEVISTRAEVFG
jgi:hypothetical protein